MGRRMCLQLVQDKFATIPLLELRGVVARQCGEECIVLEGMVNSYYLKQQAQEIVRKICVNCPYKCQVENKIKVK